VSDQTHDDQEEVGPPTLDLTNEEVGGPFEVPTLRPVHDREVFVGFQERVRALLAGAFMVLLAGTVVWAFFAAGGDHWTTSKELLELLLPAETALLGSAVGFYFGTQK